MATFTKTHYEKIAAVFDKCFATAVETDIPGVRLAMAETMKMFKQDNPKFNDMLFIAAANKRHR